MLQYVHIFMFICTVRAENIKPRQENCIDSKKVILNFVLSELLLCIICLMQHSEHMALEPTANIL